MEDAEAIFSVPGIDAIFVGPNDLAASMRSKDGRPCSADETSRVMKHILQTCRKHKVISVINDRPAIAMLADADGVHVGQGDLPAVEARKIIGNAKILGVSTHNIEQARRAMLDGADYIGVGPVFSSPTKPRSTSKITRRSA